MAKALLLCNRTINPEEIISLLADYQLLPQLGRFMIVDEAIAQFELTCSERTIALEQFDNKHQIPSQGERSGWAKRFGMTLEQLEALAMRDLKIELFKQKTWGASLESYFLTHKSKLDKVIYSLLRVTEAEVAQELYFRIKGGEQSFAELAREYSTGPEAQTGGLLGPVELSMPHPTIAKMLSISQPGQLLPPTRLGEWFVILRLEKFIPAQLDETMRQQLLNHLFEAWISDRVSKEMERYTYSQSQNSESADSSINTNSVQIPSPQVSQHSITQADKSATKVAV